MGSQLVAVLMNPGFRVKAGDLWEFNNTEWYALMYIVKVCKQTSDPEEDRFEYLTLDDSGLKRVHMSRGHLTIRTRSYGNLWKRVA